MLLGLLPSSSAAAPSYSSPEIDLTQTLLESPPLRPPFAPAASISLSVPSAVPMGQNVAFTVTFDNTGADPGYGPIIDVILDTTGADADASGGPYDGLGTSLISASYLSIPFTTSGSSQNMWVLTFDASGSATHPIMRNSTGAYITVNGTPGDTLVVLRLPFGSFTPDQPPASVSLNVNMSIYADVGTPLTIQARGGFEFGATPLDDWCCGDPGDVTLTSFITRTVTPTLLTLSKTYSGPEDEAASGPNFRSFYPMEYTVTVDIAPGQSLTNVILQDVLPDNLQGFSLLPSSPVGASCTAISASPGGTIQCSFAGPISGSASFTFDFYIPLEDASTNPVINPLTGNYVTSCDQASVSADWIPEDPRDAGGTVSESPASCEHTLTDRSVAIQKNVMDINGGGVAPGDILEYTISFQVSDYFAFSGIVISDSISDGQHFDPAFSPTLSFNGNSFALPAAAFNATNHDIYCNYTNLPLPVPNADCTIDDPATNDGRTGLEFRVSNEILSRQPASLGRLVGGCIDPLNGSADPDCGTYNDGPTSGTIVFHSIVQDQFTDDHLLFGHSGDPSVDQGDVLNNNVSISGNVLNNSGFSPTGNTESDTSTVDVSIGVGTLLKFIYALNGAAPGDPVQVKPGDNVTYRIRAVMPTGDEENLRFDDYLPLPIFQVDDPDDNGTSDPPPWIFNPTISTGVSDVPSPGEAMFGPEDTYYAYSCLGTGTPVGCLLPSLTSDVGNNSLTFDYGDFDGPDEQEYIVDLLFTVTVNNDPFADRLFLTNQVHGFEGSTNAGTVAGDAIQQIVLTEPVLLSNKAIIWTSNPNAVFDPTPPGPVTFIDRPNAPRWTGTINSTNLASVPIDSNVSFVDAGDFVTFAIVIENTGSSLNGAFDLIIRDTLPAELQIPAVADGGLNLQVYYGNPAYGAIGYNGLGGGPDGVNGTADDLFGSGIELIDPVGSGVCEAYDPNLGNNVILITFDLQIRDNITPGTIVNTESLVNYAGTEGGPNHLPEDQTDDAEITVIPSIEKFIESTEIEHINNTRSEAVIGEFVTYKITLEIPEGDVPGVQLVDTLDDGLAFEQIISVTTSPNVTHDAIDIGPSPTNPTIGSANGGTGNLLTFDLGDIDNPNHTDAVETIDIVYRAVVVNVAGNQDGTTLTNSAVLSWTGGSLPAESAPVITVIEPKLLVSKVPSPNQGDAGDTISFTMTVEHDQEAVIDAAVSNADAFELSLSDTLPGGMTYVGGSLDCTGGSLTPDTCAFVGNTLTSSWTQLTGFPLGSTSVFTFDITLDATVSPGEVITNTANLTWTSLPGDESLPRTTHNPASVERTGIGGVNDYITIGEGIVTITGSPTKSIVSTSEAHTVNVSGVERVSLGEIIRYRLVFELAEGTAINFQLMDLLPAYLQFMDPHEPLISGDVRAALVSDDPAGGITSSTLPPVDGSSNPLHVSGDELTISSITPTYLLPDSAVSSSSTDPNADTYVSGTDPYFWFGTLINNDRDDPSLEYVVVEFNVVVMNVSQNQSDSLRQDTFQARVNDAPVGNPSNAVNVRVAEPVITNLAKSVVGVLPTDAGDTFIYRYSFSNSANSDNAAAAFDIVLTDTLDSNLLFQSISLFSMSGGNCGAIVPTFSGGAVGQVVTGTLSCLNPGGTAEIDLTVRIADTTPIGVTIPNIVDLIYSSLPGDNGTSGNPTRSTTPGSPGSNSGERNGSGGVNDYVDSANVDIILADPALSKSITATSVASTGSGEFDVSIVDLVIGEEVTFEITATLSEGTAFPLVITDNLPTLPDGVLSVVSSSINAVGGQLSGVPLLPAPGPFGVASDTDANLINDQVVFDFGNVTNSPDGVIDDGDRITVQVVARVENVAENQNGDQLTNTATLTYNSETATATANIEILTPDMAILKDDGLSIISPAQILTYALAYSNNGNAEAIGVVITETVPVGTTFSTATSTSGWAGCTDGSPAGTVCTYAVGSVLHGAGGGGTVNFGVVVDDPPPPGLVSVINTATIADNGSRGPDPTPGDNTATDTDNLATLPDSDLRKTLDSTDQPHTGGADVAIGEILTYEVILTLPVGTAPSSLLTDVLDLGLAFVDCLSISPSPGLTTDLPGGFAAACTSPSVNEEPSGSSDPANQGRRVIFDLGTLTNPGPGDATLTLVYQAVTLNNEGNVRGDSLNNAVRWTWTGGDLQQTASAATIVEPTLALTKSASPRIVPPGTPITFTLNIAHAPSTDAEAFDLVLTDILPPELIYQSGTLSCSSGICTESLGVITATWDAFDLADTSTVQFDAVLINLPPDSRVTNEVSLEWTSLPEDNVSAPFSLSSYNALATERRYDPATPVDVYQVIASITVGTPALPETGFAPGRQSDIPHQPLDLSYKNLGEIWLQIPALEINAPIVGVSTGDQGWDLTWLWDRVGYLEGTAYPSWTGNTALTAHVVLPNGLPGPFADLGKLAWADRIVLHANGLQYVYHVTYVWSTNPYDLSALSHEEADWLTLITCDAYDEISDQYLRRTIVRAVLIEIQSE